MYMTASESVFMIICGGIMGFMLLMLFLANHTLITQNRYLKQRIKDKNRECMLNHAEVPF